LPESVIETANAIGAKVWQLESEYAFTFNENNFVWKHAEEPENYYSVLIKQKLEMFQLRNLSAAIAAVRSLDLTVSNNSIEKAIMSGLPKGRMQWLEARSKTWLLDVAHNPASVEVLCQRLNELKLENSVTNTEVTNNSETAMRNEAGFYLVFSMLNDKDIEACIKLLKPFIKHWYVAPLNTPRSLTAEDIDALKIDYSIDQQSITQCTTIANACFAAARESNGSLPIIVCGSFYTVVEALQFLQM